jgi:hypothetical protein
MAVHGYPVDGIEGKLIFILYVNVQKLTVAR